MPAQLERDTQAPEPLGVAGVPPLVRHGHACTAADKQFGGRRPAAFGPGHRHPTARDAEGAHRSFSVVRLNNANTTAAITNRVMTLGSLHPISSK